MSELRRAVEREELVLQQRAIPAAADLQLSVNLSTRQPASPPHRGDRRRHRRNRPRPGTLGLKITESVLMEGADAPSVLLALTAARGGR